jgi:hypothetical protein
MILFAVNSSRDFAEAVALEPGMSLVFHTLPIVWTVPNANSRMNDYCRSGNDYSQ